LRTHTPFVGKGRAARLGAGVCAAAVVLCIVLAASSVARAQQTNPVDRQVTNPLTDTPSVNPRTETQPPIRPRQRPRTEGQTGQATDQLDVRSDRQTVTGPEDARVVTNEGNVDARIGIYRLQADKVTVYEAKNLVVAEGSVVFDQGEFQRITGSRAEWNYSTKTGFFLNSTGFTNQTQDGTIMYFTADRVEKVSGTKIVIINAVVTACDEENPKWSFTSRRATITINDRVRARNPVFRVKGFPLAYLPFASVSIKPRDRASGFLTPTFSGSGKKGFRLSNAYYQTLGRSADVTFRNDIFTGRGVGFGADLRTRANSRSYFNMGFYAVKDRLFGASADDDNPDQGGSSFYVDGVHYFPNGFMAAADINITSSLAFRQIFSDRIQDAISPEERSQLFVNKNFRDYSLNFLARTQVVSIPSARIRTRQLPSISVDKRPSPLAFFRGLPVYFSFESSMDGVSRKETIEDLNGFIAEAGEGSGALVSPSMVQRLDFRPELAVPLEFGGWTATATARLRGTFYSNSMDPATRSVLARNITRSYGEFELDLRPPALARNFRRSDKSLRFRHTIEPYFVYRRIGGIGQDFHRIIRFDQTDAIADTNEIEFGVTNRFFQRRSTETVTGRVSDRPLGRPEETTRALAPQPYEALSVTIRQKYFFDPDFGGALIPGRRNQFYPINTFSGFTYGGVPRRFSPLYVEARLRPYRSPRARLRSLSVDVRSNFDVLGEGGGLRDLAVTTSLERRVPVLRLVRAFQTFYYTRAVTLAPSLRQYSDPRGNEPGTLQGSQWSPTVFLGDPDRGLFGGVSFFFDFQNRPGRGSSSLISSTTTVGYVWDCCAVTAQNYTFNVGIRQENRIVFSFRLNGIGTFGTEQIGQHLR
jgi:LPS-assembly protein